MAISQSLQQFLDGRGVPYEVVPHERTLRSSDTARVSSIPEDNLAKGVLMKRKGGYLLAIVPASCHVRLEAVAEWMKQPVCLATETDVASVFDDCELGSIPPVAGAYGLSAVMDESLEGYIAISTSRAAKHSKQPSRPTTRQRKWLSTKSGEVQTDQDQHRVIPGGQRRVIFGG